MDWQGQLAENLPAESEADGYTLGVWGGGELLLHQYPMVNVPEIFAYVGDALVGVGVLVAIAFSRFFAPAETDDDRNLFVASALHVLATFASLVFAELATIVSTSVPAIAPVVAFAAVGALVTTLYNLLLLVEGVLVRLVADANPD